MPENKNIVKKKIVRICSRLDLGMVMIREVLTFCKLKCVRSSKGGVFDQTDIVSVSSEDEVEFRRRGGDTTHSTRDWLEIKEIKMTEFFCSQHGKRVELAFCRDICYPKKNYFPTRAMCREAYTSDVSRETVNVVDSPKPVKEEVKNEVAFEGIQELRLKKIASLMNETTNQSNEGA